jgi:hypothetical protein
MCGLNPKPAHSHTPIARTGGSQLQASAEGMQRSSLQVVIRNVGDGGREAVETG